MRHSIAQLTFSTLVACSPTQFAESGANSAHLNASTTVTDASPSLPVPTAKPTAEPMPTPAVRNEGFGPYDSLERLCGAESERCGASKPVTVKGTGPVVAVATFAERPNDGTTHLAFQTADGWYVSEVPDGRPLGGGLGRHSPGGTQFDLENALVDGATLKLLRTYGKSSYMPGQGARGSSSFIEVRQIACRLDNGRVSCDAGVEIYTERCAAPPEISERKCQTSGTPPKTRP